MNTTDVSVGLNSSSNNAAESASLQDNTIAVRSTPAQCRAVVDVQACIIAG